ncbi:MAG: amidohydrolase family protein [Bacteroidetes bacterium]|nr:amidohydrolase family protein [Bacteroidota bacterium]
MLKYNTPLLITNNGPALSNVCVSVLPDGTIAEIANEFKDDAVFLEGVLVPGFVNTHCHLELSHLKNELTPNKEGMKGFIQQLFSKRFQTEDAKQISLMYAADNEMWNQGIVAVGDISNFNRSTIVKAESKIYYHTFIELLGLNPTFANAIVEKGLALQQEFLKGKNGKASLTPHAPYSCPAELLNLLFKNVDANDPLTIHMQESLDELQFCRDKSGPLTEFFNDNGISFADFIPFGEVSPLQKLLPLFPQNKLQLVHNTYTTEEEIQQANSIHSNLFWCVCIGANLFINNKVPPVDLMYKNNCTITIGTDSLASNTQLSILKEIKCIHKHFPSIPFELLVKAATANGAAFLGIDNVVGKIKVGYNPGLVLLENINVHQPQFHDHVKCKRIQ